MAALVAQGFVDEAGMFSIDHRSAFREAVKRFSGQEVIVTVKPKADKRTLNQNAYWWAEPVPRIAAYCGETAASMHYQLLGECFGYKTGALGQLVLKEPSSSELSKEKFSHLIDWVGPWAQTTLNLRVMAPNEWTAAGEPEFYEEGND